MQLEFLFSGFGGQGVMFAGQLLAYSAMESGLEATWIPSYGPEMRGGTAHCYVVVSNKPIGSPIVRHPKVVASFNIPSFDKYEFTIAEDGIFAYNASLIERQPKRDDITYFPVKASETAEELGSIRLTNVVMLGAILTVLPIISLQDVSTALDGHIPAHRKSMLQMNINALHAGRAIAEEFLHLTRVPG